MIYWIIWNLYIFKLWSNFETDIYYAHLKTSVLSFSSFEHVLYTRKLLNDSKWMNKLYYCIVNNIHDFIIVLLVNFMILLLFMRFFQYWNELFVICFYKFLNMLISFHLWYHLLYCLCKETRKKHDMEEGCYKIKERWYVLK